MNKTQICNVALMRVGIAQPIADISDNSASGRACKMAYDNCLETMYRERPWPFATRQVELAVVSEQSFGEWLYSYRYPSNYVNVHRLLQVSTSSSDSTLYYTPSYGQYYNPYYDYYTATATSVPKIPFQIGSDSQGKLIHTNLECAYAIGTYLVTDPTLFDPMFSSALSWFIGSEIALVLSKEESIRQRCLSEYERIVSDAAATAHNESKPQSDFDCDMIAARE